jgi:hypothetical protein
MQTNKLSVLSLMVLCLICLCMQAYADSLQKLVTDLKNPEESLRAKAAEQLGQLKAPEAVETLIATLADQSPVVRIAAIKALGSIGDPRAFQPLQVFLKEGPISVRLCAEQVLTDLTMRNKDLLQAALTDPKPYVRFQYVKLLQDQDRLARFARSDPDTQVRLAAIEKINDDQMFAELARQDQEVKVRLAAIKRISDRKILIDLARDTNLASTGSELNELGERLLSVEGVKLPARHLEIARDIKLMLLDPLVVKHLGELKMRYDTSTKVVPYRIKPGEEFSGERVHLVMEQVRIKISTSRGKVLSQSLWNPIGKPQSEEIFQLGYRLEGGRTPVGKQFDSEVNVDSVFEAVLRHMPREALIQLAQTGLIPRTRVVAAQILEPGK